MSENSSAVAGSNPAALTNLRDRLMAERERLVTRLAAAEHLDAGLISLLATVQGCLDAVAEIGKEAPQ